MLKRTLFAAWLLAMLFPLAHAQSCSAYFTPDYNECANVTTPYTVQNPVAGNTYNWTVGPEGTIVSGQGTPNLVVQWNQGVVLPTPIPFYIDLYVENSGLGCDDYYSHSAYPLDIRPGLATGPDQVCLNSVAVYTYDFNQPLGGTGGNATMDVNGGTVLAYYQVITNYPQTTLFFIVDWDTPGVGEIITYYESFQAGCGGFDTLDVTVSGGSGASPSISGPASGCGGSPQAYSVSPVAGATYTWSVQGDGSVTSGQGTPNAQISFGSATDSAYVVVGVDNGSCVAYSYQAVSLQSPPAFNITGTDNTCPSVQEAYSCTAGILSPTWTVSNGTIVSGQGTDNIQVTLTGSSTIQVSGSLSGCGVSASKNVAVTQPAPPAVISGPSGTCPATPETFSVPFTSSATYNWSITGGNILSGQGTNQISAEFTVNGAQSVSVVQTDSCGNVTNDNQSVNVTNGPVPVISGVSSFCSNNSTLFSTPFNAGNTYVWTVTNGTIINGQGSSSITVEFNNAGPATVSVVEDAGGCSGTDSKNITVQNGPNPNILGGTTACQFYFVGYTTANNAGSTYNWTITGGTIASGQGTNTVTVRFLTPGAQSLSVEEDNGACVTVDQISVQVGQLPIPSVTGPASACLGQTVSYTTNFTAGSTYNWSVGGGTIVSGQGTNTIQVEWTSTGSNPVTVTETNAGCFGNNTQYVSVGNGLGTAISGIASLCEGAIASYSTPANGGATYNWSVTGGTIISGQGTNAVSVQFTAAGNQSVSVTESKNGCTITDSYGVTVNANPAPGISGPASACLATSVSYSTTNNVGSSYNWTVSGGTIVSGQGTASITVSFNTSGSQTVAVTETNNGCVGNDAFNVNVNSGLTPVIAGATLICDGATETYSTTNNAGSSYNWTVSGGTILSGQGTAAISVQFTSTGAQTLSVTETNAGCSGNDSYAVTVNSNPSPGISGTASLCAGATASYSTANNAGSNYNWSVSGGTIVSGQGTNSVSVQFTSAGNQSVSVIETNSGCSGNDSYPVTVTSNPAPGISGPASACLATSVSYSTTNNAGSSYNWTVSGGTIVSGQGTASITVSFNTAGSQTVSVTETNSGCVGNDAFNVNVNSGLTPVIAGATSTCDGSTESYSTTSNAGSSYNWTVSGGTILSGQGTAAISVQFTSTGAQTLSVTETNAGCTGNDSYAVTVFSNPAPGISGTASLCAGATASYSTANNAGSNYNWSVSGGTIVSGQGTNTISVQFTSAGNQSVSVTETNSGCSGNDSHSVTVNANPAPGISGPASACLATSVSYSTTNNVGSSYNWTVSGGTIVSGQGTASVMVSFNTSGSQTVSVTETNSGCVGNDAFSVNVNSGLTPAIAGATSTCDGSTESYSTANNAGSSYNWTVSGGTILSGQGSASISVQFSSTGAQTVSVTETNAGCTGNDSYALTVNANPAPGIFGTASLCEGATASYSTTNNVGSSYNWTVSGGTIISGQGTNTVSVQFSSAGNQSVSVTETNSGCSGNDSYSVTVNANPAPGISGPASACLATSVSYSTTNNAGSSYNWTVSGGTIVSGQGTASITVSFNTSGSQTVSVTETNNGCVGNDAFSVNVNSGLTPVIAGATSTCDGSTESYSTTSNAGSSYNWTVSGGTILSGQGTAAISVQFTSTGAQTLAVTETNAGCSGNDSYAVTVNSNPAPGISGTASLCEGATGSYSTTNNAGSNYNWTISGGTIVSGQGTNSVSVQFTSAGNQSVSVTETNNGCSGNDSYSVTVNANPAPGISGPASACLATSVSYSTTNNVGSSYNWTVSGGTIVSGQGTASITVSFNTSGSQTVSVTETNSGCVGNDAFSVNVNSNPAPVISGNNSLCEGETAVYSTTNNTGSSYTWAVGGGVIQSGQGTNAVTILFTSAGSPAVSVVETNNGCSGSDNFSVSVNTNPNPSLSGPATACVGATVTYSTTNNAGSSYLWAVSGGNILSGQGTSSISVQFTSTGNQSVGVTETNNGCSGASGTNVNVTSGLTPVISGPTSGCVGGTASYSTANNAGSSYSWTVSGGTITSGQGTASITVLYSASGNQTVGVTETNGSCSGADSYAVNVSSGFTVNATTNKSTVYVGYPPEECADLTATPSGGSAPYSYAWSNGGSGQTINVCPQTTTTYTVTVTDAGGCSAVASVQVEAIDISCGNGKVYVCTIDNRGRLRTRCLQTFQVAGELNNGGTLGPCPGAKSNDTGAEAPVTDLLDVAPNPFSNHLNIRFETAESGPAVVRVFSLDGRMMAEAFNGNVAASDVQALQVSSRDWSEGVYFVRLQTETGSITWKKVVLMR